MDLFHQITPPCAETGYSQILGKQSGQCQDENRIGLQRETGKRETRQNFRTVYDNSFQNKILLKLQYSGSQIPSLNDMVNTICTKCGFLIRRQAFHVYLYVTLALKYCFKCIFFKIKLQGRDHKVPPKGEELLVTDAARRGRISFLLMWATGCPCSNEWPCIHERIFSTSGLSQF